MNASERKKFAKSFVNENETSGIYEMRNTVNGRFYIGRTNDFFRRINEHVYSLDANIHCSQELQKDWNKYGYKAFTFTMLFPSDDLDILHSKERVLIEILFDNNDRCYNAKGYVVDWENNGALLAP